MTLRDEWEATDHTFDDARAAEPIELRPYQTDAITRINNSIARGVRRIMVQLATGAGKTHIASAMTAGYRQQNKPVIFTVPAIELVDQTLEKFHREGIRDVGVMQAQHWRTDTSRPIQIASVQTLMRREIPPAELVFIDEAHKIFNFYSKWFTDPAWKDVPFIGLSATPWAKGLGRLYQDLIIAATTQDLIGVGYLSKFRVFAPAHPDLKGVRTIAGDYHEGDLGTVMDKTPLVADIVSTWLKHGAGRPTLCFAVNRLHAQHIRNKFEEAGVCAGYVDCFSTPSERVEVRSKFASGEFQVVCNVGVLTMGVDWDVRCIILARPTKSEMLFVQIIGRGLRPANDKDHCLILDHSDTTSRLGFVTDIHHEQLDDVGRIGNAWDRVKLPKECPRCACLRPPSTNICPNCGFEAKPVNTVRVVDGELRELDRNKRQIVNPIEVYGQFKYICERRGYKPGWAYHKAEEYFGRKPEGFDAAAPCPPSQTILRWEKSRRIAYAKGRARGLTALSSTIAVGGIYPSKGPDDIPF
jgi:DNA repair protein RadD